MEKSDLEKLFGKVWDTSELEREFSVKGFLAPFVVVTRKVDQTTGTLTFQHHPRYYYSFEPSGNMT